MTTPDQTGRTVPVRRGRRAVRIVLLCLAVAAILFLATTSWLSGR
jgi:hypothetical protein